MQLSRYTYKISENFLDYEFSSIGPNGKINKVVRFTEIGINVYNIGFGDLDEKSGQISDITVTNNRDSRKVLATVAATLHDFMLQHPRALIIAQGSTSSRTRLYRMGITNHWAEIRLEFEVFGLKDNTWEPFQFGKNYEAFLVRHK